MKWLPCAGSVGYLEITLPMGQQSIPQPSRRVPVSLWAMQLLFFSALLAQSQTPATSIPLILPSAIAYDSVGNLYIAETSNHVIREVDTAGEITTVAGTGTQGYAGDNGSAMAALLDSPQGLAVDGSNLYIADTHNHRIRRVDLTTGLITTIAGSTAGFSGDNGAATSAQLDLPSALAVDASHNLYIADTHNHRIRRLNLTTNQINTVVGDGVQGFSGDNGLATAAAIDSPTGLAVDAEQNLYLADTHNHRIRKITAATGVITTIAGATAGFSGDNGAAAAAMLALPHGLSIDTTGDLYIADTANHRIRRIDAITGVITTVAGNGTQNFGGDNGPATAASLDSPRAAAMAPSGLVTLADSANQRVRQLDAETTPEIHTIAGLSSATTGGLVLTAPATILYGTGQLTATLASVDATGSITFTLLDSATANGTTLGTAPLTGSTAAFDTSVLPVGTYSVLAAYSGDHPAAQSQPLSFSVTPRPITLTPDAITLLYGQAVPVLTGAIDGELPQDDVNLTATFSSSIGAFSSPGVYPIGSGLGGSAAKNYTFTAAPASVTIAQAPTYMAVGPSATSIAAGVPLTLTANAVSTTAGTPTGSVVFKDGATILMSAANPATYTTSVLAPGVHSITTLYGGDRNFIASASAPLLISVISGAGSAPDFSLISSGATSQTIPSGGTANFNFTMQIEGAALSSPITLAASGLPAFATASFNPAYLPPGTTPSSFTLTINMPQTSALQNVSKAPLLALLLFPFAGMTFRKRGRCSVMAMMLAGVLVLCSGCGSRVNTGGASANPPKTYTITVTGTATSPSGGVLQHSTAVSLLVEPAN